MRTTRAERKQNKRERKQRWKAAKKERRAALKAQYQDAPGLVRFWNVYAKKPLKTIFYIVLIAALLSSIVPQLFESAGQMLFMTWYESTKNNPVDSETIYALSPLDEEGGKRIDAIAPVDADDTWTICVYLVGSNLEDMDENDLSYMTKLETQNTTAAIQANKRETLLSRLAQFEGELSENGLEMPSYFYYPVKPEASSVAVTTDVVVADRVGAATSDIAEMDMADLSPNIRIVIQTGGATRWSNQLVNPNRTQRFLLADGSFREIENLPLQPCFAPETLADFIGYCRDNYPADHQMLVLWNHGGGAFGYGNDSIFGGLMSLPDIREALSMACEPDIDNPPFDVIGFDACLMASLEVTHALDGFASYYAVSEETEPGDGWNYTDWLNAMAADPTMSPAAVCRAVADTYMDYYMTQNSNVGVIIDTDVTFSVLDAKKCSALYDAYCDLARAQLARAAEDISVLSELGRCSDKATHFLSSYYSVFNTVDLGNYVDFLVDSFPEEASRVKELLGEAVLYHRESGSLSDAQGISIYVPATIDSISGMQYFLIYLNEVPVDDSIRTLYYYKVAGCLNDEMRDYLATLTEAEPKTLDTAPFRQFGQLVPVVGQDGFSIPVGEDLQSMMQNYTLEVSQYDEKKYCTTYYGYEQFLSLDGEGNLVTDFDGRWICLDGVPLAVEVASSSASSVEYRAKVRYNNKPAYLVFDYDRDTEEFSIEGVRTIPDPSQDGINYLSVTRAQTEVTSGSTITPIYVQDDFNTFSRGEVQGKSVKLTANSKIERQMLPNGYYLCSDVITDQRGENYYSAIVGHTIAGGKLTDRAVDQNFIGRDY